MNANILRETALALGFGDAALCSADDFDREREIVRAQPELKERRQLRYSPCQDDPRIKSIAVLLWPYRQAAMTKGRSLFIDSYYAASNCAYHAAVQLQQILLDAGCFAKANVSYPARKASVRAGLGIIGENGLLIHPKFGTRTVIILMATDIPCTSVSTDEEQKTCLQCGKCSAACPVGAIGNGFMRYPERCLRNYMMEGIAAPEDIRSRIGNRLLGCDMCQRVCPMQPKTEDCESAWPLDALMMADDAVFSQQAAALGEIIGRNAARPQRIRAQAALVCGNVGDVRDLPVLRRWADSPFESVSVHAKWAIEQIESRIQDKA